MEKFDDYTKSGINSDLTSETSLLNDKDIQFTDTADFDQQFEGIPEGTPVGGRQASTIADTINSDGTVDTTHLSGAIPQANLNLADRGWVQTCVFSLNGATPATQVDWGAGTFTSADGTTYAIDAGNTGVMGAKNYIYLDIAVLTTAYQKTTIATTAVGVGKVMIAIAQNGTTEATFQVLQGQGGQNMDAANIVAGSITANEIAASTITSGKMSVTQLSAISADLGAVTAGSININSGKAIITSTGDATFKSYNLMSQYTAGENITIGHLLCIKHKLAAWGDDDGANKDTTAIISAMTYVDPDHADTAYGATGDGVSVPYLGMGSGGAHGRWIYGKIDVVTGPNPGLPDWTEVESVKLRLYVVTASAQAYTASLYRLTDAFVENTITWNNKPADDGVAWATAQSGTTYLGEEMASPVNLTDDGYLDFDITQLYRLWLAGKLDNYGFVIKTDAVGGTAAAKIGGRTRAGGGYFNQAPCLIFLPIVNDPGSITFTVNDGKVYHASSTDYNLVKNVVGIAGATVTAGNIVDVYALADRSIIPSSVLSVTTAKTYYLNNTDGTIGFLTNDIVRNDEWNLKIGTGTANGLCIDYDKNPMFIKSETYPVTGILPPPHARMAVILWSIVAGGVKGEIILYKDRITNVTDLRDASAYNALCVWASGTSGLLTAPDVSTIYWYK